MPYVNLKIAGSLTTEQKKKIAQEITDTLERVAQDRAAEFDYVVKRQRRRQRPAMQGS